MSRRKGRKSVQATNTTVRQLLHITMIWQLGKTETQCLQSKKKENSCGDLLKYGKIQPYLEGVAAVVVTPRMPRVLQLSLHQTHQEISLELR